MQREISLRNSRTSTPYPEPPWDPSGSAGDALVCGQRGEGLRLRGEFAWRRSREGGFRGGCRRARRGCRAAASEALEAEAKVSGKAWEAGPGREVLAARRMAARRCGDLPGPGHRGTWVSHSPPHPSYFWREAQSCSVQPRRVRSPQVAGDPGTVGSGVGLTGSP